MNSAILILFGDMLSCDGISYSDKGWEISEIWHYFKKRSGSNTFSEMR